MMENYLPTELAKTKAFQLKHSKLILRILKAALFTSIVALAWALSSNYVWANGEQIIGSWVIPDDKAVVEIYQQEG